jgi:two-component system phosphate regulon sensor histidine kinase PhoR
MSEDCPVSLVYFCFSILAMRLRLLQFLMTVTILGIMGFQGYWLKQNYDREKRNLEFKTDVTFRETIMQLQGKNLKFERSLPFAQHDTVDRMRVFINSEHPETRITRTIPEKDIAATLSIVTKKLKDSLKKVVKSAEGRMVVSMDNSLVFSSDSTRPRVVKWKGREPGDKDFIMELLTGLDSLQDTLSLKEVQTAYSKALDVQKINIPFTISSIKADMPQPPQHPDEPNKVTVGFSKPVTFKLVNGNTVPYLLKRLSSPILFSVFLIGLTVISFVLLYRNMKKQQRLAELKNDFISNITHELKTPIATVGVAIEALKNFNAMQNPERTKEYLDISSNELQRLNLLVDKVLKLSMFEKKEIQLNIEPLDLKALTDEVLASMRLQLEKRNASVTLSHSGSSFIEGDKLHLLSVIFNLVDNALKYSPENPQIKIDIAEKENNLELRIADNGLGVPDEYKSKVFEKFFRVPAGNVHNIKGYGLGLSYAASVINKHGGTIQATNNDGGGTIFIITLPKA